MFTTFVHLACDALSRLIALDEGDGLLNLKTLIQPVPRQYEGGNMPIIIVVALCGGVMEFLVSQPFPESGKIATDPVSTDKAHHHPRIGDMSRSRMYGWQAAACLRR
jgi:hypothetical protein